MRRHWWRGIGSSVNRTMAEGQGDSDVSAGSGIGSVAVLAKAGDPAGLVGGVFVMEAMSSSSRGPSSRCGASGCSACAASPSLRALGWAEP